MRAIDLGGGYVVTTNRTQDVSYFGYARYGQANALVGAEVGDERVVRRLTGVGIDKHVRGWEKPSDHVPVWAELALEPKS